MLTDMIVEEEFEMKEDEPWYDHQDLEQDLHLAAELGKTLLDRNRELEQGMQQMYTTNQEQLQEIEYLSKQVDLLRQMNEQHVKLYEQLDVTARDLEKGNQRLVLDNRSAQHKIQSLTETIDGLQVQMEELQRQVEEMKTPPSEHQGVTLIQQRCCLGAQSISCLEELYNTRRYSSVEHGHADCALSAKVLREQEENANLKRSVQTLQTQLGAERARRVEAEREAEVLAQETAELEQRMAELEGCQAQQWELEAEVEELRQLWRSDTAGSRKTDQLFPEAAFFGMEESVEPGDELEVKAACEQVRRVLTRCSSESQLKMGSSEEMWRGHERTCVRRAEVIKQRGISLLNEVDAQYRNLQVKYDELLRHCQQGPNRQSHKAVQTPGAKVICGPAPSIRSLGFDDDSQQPEYKALFREIFKCIQKTKEDLTENRASLSQAQ
ncbi:cerebellar degeneration-related protein 2-like [Arapaima gigas]